MIDGHADSFGDVLTAEPRDYLVESSEGHLDLPRQRAGGIDLTIQAVYTPPEYRGDAALAYCADFTARILLTLACAGDELALVREIADLDTLVDPPRTPSLMLHLEGATPLAGKLARVELLDAWGYRSIGLTHDFPSEAAGGSKSTGDEDRLTDFGRLLVAEVDRRGWLLDVAHIGPRSLHDVLEASVGPVVSTHTGLAQLAPTPRNLDDDACRAIAATGGLIAIDFVPQHLVRPVEGQDYAVDRESYFAHLDRAVELLGDEHVGIGSDFDGYGTPLGGMNDARDFPWLTERMLAAGYSESSIRKILGGNFLRVLRARLSRRARMNA